MNRVRTKGIINAAAICCAGITAHAVAGPPNLLNNPNFETPGAFDVFDEWVDFGGNIIPELTDPLEGVASVHMFGQFSGLGQNDTVMIHGNAGLAVLRSLSLVGTSTCSRS